jgi:predicted nucleic acid-binding protein
LTIVIDASVTMAWCFEDEAVAGADAVLDLLRDQDAVVPALWQLEVANVLTGAERRRRMSEAQVARFVELLQQLPIHVDTAPVEMAAVIAASRQHGLSAYDSAYLLLAERLGVALATLDDALASAARAAGVTVLAHE